MFALIVGDETNPPWLKLELSKIQLIHKVLIYNRFFTNWFYPNNECAKNEDYFKNSCLSDHDNVAVTVYQGEVERKSCGTLKLTDGLAQSDQIYTIVCNAQGDAVIFSKGEGEIRIWEIVVIGAGKHFDFSRQKRS